MSTPLRSTAISIVSHALVIAALYLVPATAVRQFSTAGQRTLITMTASRAVPLASSVMAIDSPPPPLSEHDPGSETMSASEPPERQLGEPERQLDEPERQLGEPERQLGEPEWQFSEPERQRTAAAKLQPSLPIADLSPVVVGSAPLVRPTTEQPMPALPPVDVTPPRPAAASALAPPPAVNLQPLEQFVGTSEQVPVDFSRNEPPAYPSQAVQQQLEGVVMLQLSVDRRGQVTEVEVIRSSGHRMLDQAAVEAVSQWQGEPAMRWGRAIESIETLPIRFRL